MIQLQGYYMESVLEENNNLKSHQTLQHAYVMQVMFPVCKIL